MKKVLAIVIIAGALLIPITVSAAWYYTEKNITLPRTGQWNTIDRTATSDTQWTNVMSNNYDVLSFIELKDGKDVGPVRTFKSGVMYVPGQSHLTNLNGASIHASFKTSIFNYFTTTAKLGWAP